MLKKSVLFIAAILSAATFLTGCSEEKSSSGSSSSGSSSSSQSASPRTIDQSSKESLTAAFLIATANKDKETLWNLLSPGEQYKYLKLGEGSTADAKNLVAKKAWGKATPQALDDLKKLCSDPEQLNKKVQKHLSKLPSNTMFKIDAKWYIDDF